MAIRMNLAGQLIAIDRQIIDLLAERSVLCREALDENSHALDADVQAEILSHWQETADEKGLSMSAITAICKGAMRLHKTEE
jgi:chorismate mutase